MTKEEVIKDVVGENLTKYCDENGWFDFIPIGFTLSDCDKKGLTKYRPKSLQGIENNNGWIKIESEADLPKEYGEFYFRTTYNTSITYTGWYSSSDKKFYDRSHYFDIVDVTHFQPIDKPKPPIY